MVISVSQRRVRRVRPLYARSKGKCNRTGKDQFTKIEANIALGAAAGAYADDRREEKRMYRCPFRTAVLGT